MSNRREQGCEEYRALSRRDFLRSGSLATAATFTAPAWLPSVALGRAGGGPVRDVLIHVFLRGGIDGLSACPPHGDGDYYSLRPNLAIPQPGQAGGAIDLDGLIGLNPAASPLMTPFNAGDLAIVHASGSTDPTRSHFDAMKAMERGLPEQDLEQLTTGWLGRTVAGLPPSGSGLVRGLSLEDFLPMALVGAPAVIPTSSPETFSFPGNPATAPAREPLVQAMYQNAKPPLAGAALTTFDTIALLESIDFENYAPAGGAVYPDSDFGQKLRSTAALIRAGIGVEVVSIDYGGWDHHNQQGPQGGTLAGMLGDLSASLEAFYQDLADIAEQWTLLMMSEFGRRAGENGSLGTDHGHGNVVWLMGGNVVGGVHTDWPGLSPGDLVQGDLDITTDYRDVLAEVLTERLGVADLSGIFPGHDNIVFPGVTT